jgi:alkylhydroperoxidase domain protein
MSEHVNHYDDQAHPSGFTLAVVPWLPWLQPLDIDALSDAQWAALVDPKRAKSAYFRVLVRAPAILAARTKTDKDIFYNLDGGLPRAERELAATAVSRFNGCVYCASVHARFAIAHAKREADLLRLLDVGVEVDIDARWNAIIQASVALTETPPSFGPVHIRQLQRVGLDDVAIADVINGAAFFNWANRLMLSLGEPVEPVATATTAP